MLRRVCTLLRQLSRATWQALERLFRQAHKQGNLQASMNLANFKLSSNDVAAIGGVTSVNVIGVKHEM